MGSKKTECESIDAKISICRQLDGGSKLIFAASRRKSNVDSHRHYSNPPTCRPSSITWLVENDFNQMLLKFCGQVTWEIKLPLPPIFTKISSVFRWWLMCVWLELMAQEFPCTKDVAPESAFERQSSENFQGSPTTMTPVWLWPTDLSIFICLFVCFLSLSWLNPCVCVCVGAVALTTTWHCQMSSIIGQSQQKESCTGKK